MGYIPPSPDPYAPGRGGRGPKRRRRRWTRVLLVIGGAVTSLLVAGVILIAVVSRHLTHPASVPTSWKPATVRPHAATPAIPPGNLVFDSDRTGNYEIWTMDPTGAGAHQLTNDREYDTWWARLSPDRRTILFYRTPRGVHDTDYSKASLWAMTADGKDPVELRPAGLDGWVIQGHAEWSPDGSRLVMAGGSRFGSQIWLTDNLGLHPQAVTNRPGSNIDPSWSPDGRTIVFVGCPGSFCTPGDQEVYTIPVSGGAANRMTNDSLEDNDPYFSHSGRTLAWLTKVSGGLSAPASGTSV